MRTRNQNPFQLRLDLFGQQADFLSRRDKIARDHKIANPELLTEKSGNWYCNGLPLEDWDDLYKGNDNSDLYRKRN